MERKCHKKRKCSKMSSECRKIYEPLRTEFTEEFGIPVVIGNPAPGPIHGQGSYWDQVGYLAGEAQGKTNLAGYVVKYLFYSGRLSEYLGPAYIGLDSRTRRRNYTRVQLEQQITDLLASGDLNADVVDYYEGFYRGLCNYALKVSKGEAPIPAEFEQGLVAFDLENDCRDLFTLANAVNGFSFVSDSFSALRASRLQRDFINRLLNAVSDDPSAGNADSNQIFNDILGINGVTNNRWTAAEGDRSEGNCISKPVGSDYSKSCNKGCGKRWKPCIRSKRGLSKHGASKVIHEPTCGEQLYDLPQGMSNSMGVAPCLSKDKTAMLQSNGQYQVGFGDILNGVFMPLNHLTPRGSSETCGTSVHFGTRGGEGQYSFVHSAQVNVSPGRDGIIEDVENLTLIYDSGTDTENVPGGKEHATLKVLGQPVTVIDIYQGKDRKGLQNGFFVTDPVTEESKVIISRNPVWWMKDALVLNLNAVFGGMVPIKSLSCFKKALETYPVADFVLNAQGIDTDGNLFVTNVGQLTTVSDSLADRKLLQDATLAKNFEITLNRPLPVPNDTEYFRAPIAFVKNPPCGFGGVWNTVFYNSDPIINLADTRTQFEFNRVGVYYKYVADILKTKDKLDFEDVRQAFTLIQISRHTDVTTGVQNYGANPFPFIKDELLSALYRKGESVGLTADEVSKAIELLKSYDGRAIPNLDVTDRVQGRNFDGRFILSSLWLSFLQINLAKAAISDPAYRATVTGLNGPGRMEPLDTVPDVVSRCSPAGIASTFMMPVIFRVLDLGPDLGNVNEYDWNVAAGLLTQDDKEIFIAQALKDGLERLVQGTNAGTGLEGPPGRANLDLILPNGVPVHPGWGQDQRTTASQDNFLLFPLTDEVVTLWTDNSLNSEGTQAFAEIDPCKKKFVRNQVGGQMGAWSFQSIENDQLVIGPHVIDQHPYLQGNYVLPEHPFCNDKKVKRCCKH